MASNIVVPVVKLVNFREHPNADLLGLADVLGYQVVVPLTRDDNGIIVRYLVKDEDGNERYVKEPVINAVKVHFSYSYSSDKLYVYFPADTVLPKKWVDKFNVAKYLRGPNNDRVSKISIRGEPSFGLVVPVPDGLNVKEGDNLAEYFEATKYEPPAKIQIGEVLKLPDIEILFDRFTDIQNGRIYINIFSEGEEVVCTEKIHGTNCGIGRINGQIYARSMNYLRCRPKVKDSNGNVVECSLDDIEALKSSVYWYPFTLDGVRTLLLNSESVGIDPLTNIIIYGEVYGARIQELDYGISKHNLGFRAFGIKVGYKFLDWDDFIAICQKANIQHVPILYRGPFKFELIKQLADGKSMIADHIREGVVVYPVKERFDAAIGRCVLKYIGINYSLSKYQEHDRKDV